MPTPRILFFGSFQHYSAKILDGLLNSSAVEVVGVVTTPPFTPAQGGPPVPSPVQHMAETRNLSVFTPEELTDIELNELDTWLKAGNQTIDLLVTAGYGKLLPDNWLSFPPAGALNLHFSLLPAYRGANPAEWALLRNETTTGVTLIEMGAQFDTGRMIAQSTVPIANEDTRETLYEKLYTIGSEVLPAMISQYFEFMSDQTQGPPLDSVTMFLPPLNQAASTTPYAKRFTRNDSFIAWNGVQAAMAGEVVARESLSELLQTVLDDTSLTFDANFFARAVRALAGFPSLWTMIPTAKGEKRMKILSVTVSANQQLVLEQVQIEGQSAATWNQVKNVIQVS